MTNILQYYQWVLITVGVITGGMLAAAYLEWRRDKKNDVIWVNAK